MTDDVKADIKEIKTILKVVIKNMATKEDLQGFATKEDFQGMATKEDLQGFATKEDFQGMATKEDLQGFATKEDFQGMATKEDLQNFATKEDLKQELQKYATKEDLEELAVSIQKEFQNIHNQMLTKEVFLQHWEVFESRYQEHLNLKSQVDYNEKRLEKVEAVLEP